MGGGVTRGNCPGVTRGKCLRVTRGKCPGEVKGSAQEWEQGVNARGGYQGATFQG